MKDYRYDLHLGAAAAPETPTLVPSFLNSGHLVARVRLNSGFPKYPFRMQTDSNQDLSLEAISGEDCKNTDLRDVLGKLEDIVPYNLQTQRFRFNEKMAVGDYSGAINHLEKILDRTNHLELPIDQYNVGECIAHSFAHYHKALLSLRREDVSPSIKSINRAVEVNLQILTALPTDINATNLILSYYARSEIYEFVNLLDEAVADVNNGLNVCKDYRKTLGQDYSDRYVLGLVSKVRLYTKKGNSFGASKLFNSILDEKGHEGYIYLGDAIAPFDQKLAIKFYRNAIDSENLNSVQERYVLSQLDKIVPK